MPKTVAILGASPNSSRYAFLALKKLRQHGHRVILVNPKYEEIEGLPCLKNLEAIEDEVETLTVYLQPEHLKAYLPSIIELRPHRVIFNPGSEDEHIAKALGKANIEVLEACTLVMLSTQQF